MLPSQSTRSTARQARMLARIEPLMHWVYGRRKQQLFRELPQRIVEIGPGAGGNFRYYPAGTTVVAVEPNEAAHAQLAARARRFRLALELCALPVEQLPLPDADAQTVIATLVLCSVDDLHAAVAQMYRVLKPGGRLRLVEHVRAQPGTLARKMQNRLACHWPRWFNNCHVDRETLAAVGRLGFRHLDVCRFDVGWGLFPFSPHVAIDATK